MILMLIGLVALFAPNWLQSAATAHDLAASNQPASPMHILGTDGLGRNIFARVLVSTRLTLELALEAVVLGAIAGITIGGLAGVAPARLRRIILRVIDAVISFPGIIVAILISIAATPGAQGAAIGVATALAFSFARLASSLAVSIGGRDYVAAARVIGVRPSRLLVRYILPNIADTLLIAVSVAVATSIVQVASLSFLGLGVQPPLFDWGRLLSEGIQGIYINPAGAIGPAIAIAVTAVAFGLTGEAFARALNPVLWGDDAKPTTRPRARNGNGVPVPTITTGSAPGETQEALLEVKDLYVRFAGPDGPVNVVEGVSFKVGKGEMVGIVGESGSGKTMTALAIADLLPSQADVHGSIRLGGETLSELSPRDRSRHLARTVAVIFQDPMASLNPMLRIGEQLIDGTIFNEKMPRRLAKHRALDRLREVRLPTAERQFGAFPRELSGGMRQRVMIAMGLMIDAGLLIADEPTTALDVTIQAQIMSLLRAINKNRSMAVVLISHNLALIRQNCSRVIVMYAGVIVETLMADELAERSLHPYTRRLIAAVPDESRSPNEPLVAMPGQPPDPANRPSGCVFHPRCELAVDKCRRARPPLVHRQDGSSVACWVVNGDTE